MDEDVAINFGANTTTHVQETVIEEEVIVEGVAGNDTEQDEFEDLYLTTSAGSELVDFLS